MSPNTSISISSPGAGSANAASSYTANGNSNINSNNALARPANALPSHMRPQSTTSNYNNTNSGSPASHANSNWKGKAPQTPASSSTSVPGRTGLNTPGQTPAGQNQKQVMPPPGPPQGKPQIQAPPNHRPISSHPIPPLPNVNSAHKTTSTGATAERDRRVSFASTGPESVQRSVPHPVPSTSSVTSASATTNTFTGHRVASTSRREQELELAPEDSFFTSDDDALLAAFDMVEADALVQKVTKSASTTVDDTACNTSHSNGTRAETVNPSGGRAGARANVSGSSSSGSAPAPSSTPPVGGFRFPKDNNVRPVCLFLSVTPARLH